MAVNDLTHRRSVSKTAMALEQHTVIHATASASGRLNPSKSLTKLSVVGVVVVVVLTVAAVVVVVVVVMLVMMLVMAVMGRGM